MLGVGARRLRSLVLITSLFAAVAGSSALAPIPPAGAAAGATSSAVWLCQPGTAHDPCTSSLTATVVRASGASSVAATPIATSSRFDCFYVYPTVSRQRTRNADLRVQRAEIDAAVAQASRFSSVCRVWAPMYRQVTLQTLQANPSLQIPPAATATAYGSLRAAFSDYLAHDNDGRPVVFIGHSQGSAMLILLLRRLVDNNPTLRRRLVLAILPGGNVEVRDGASTGTFRHIPVCAARRTDGCVIAYSSFPGAPPPGALFGRPGQGASLQSGQRATRGVRVACVNPVSPGASGSTILSPYFLSLGTVATPWVTYPGLYTARCQHADGATWLQVTKATGSSDDRPVVEEQSGPEWGYHTDDVNLALGDLVADVARAERAWTKGAGR